MISHQRSNLPTVLICLTLIAIITQLAFFIIHYHVTDLLDSLVASSLKGNLLQPVILIPMLGFILLQILIYVFFVFYIWFITTANAEFFNVSEYWLGIVLWTTGAIAIIALNNYFYSSSFFAYLIRKDPQIYGSINFVLMVLTLSILVIATFIAYLNIYKQGRHYVAGGILLAVLLLIGFTASYDELKIHFSSKQKFSSKKPNIIFIGLDSARPDFIDFSPNTRTPNVKNFYETSLYFADAYTPLARTFPSWVSILTGQYPKHNHARINLDDPNLILPRATLASYLKQEGYQTIYATDEKRFSNITEAYGFDEIWGPRMGLNDFLLGGFSDFPLTNLTINVPLGRWLFPYNYANRAEAITYQPKTFLHLIKLGLSQRQDKPLFLAVHLCLSHWPYTWAQDGLKFKSNSAERYKHSLEAVDQQLGELLHILKSQGLLENTLVVLLSDHGTTVGLPGDRIVAEKNYEGPKKKMKWLTVFKSQDGKRMLNTSYGQGTDVLSLKQYQVLLAMKGYGIAITPKKIIERTSLIDITPTIMDFLHITPQEKMDGVSKISYVRTGANTVKPQVRPFYLETGYSISEIESKDIFVEKVIKRTIGLYEVNPKNGLLFIKPQVEQSVITSKQRAVLWGDWMLAYYPPKTRKKLIPATHNKKVVKSYVLPAYFVLVNLKNEKWTVDLNSMLAKQAPMKELMGEFKAFYGEEVALSS